MRRGKEEVLNLRSFLGTSDALKKETGNEAFSEQASITVEAAFLYPFLILITCLLVTATMQLYAGVQRQSKDFYNDSILERGMDAAERIRVIDTAFELVEGE